MKNLITTTLAILLTISIYGQSYIPLPDSNAKWCILHNNGTIPPPVHGYTNYYETYYSGDTTIANRHYKKIEKTEYDIFCLNTKIQGSDYLGAIRDDSIKRQVFYIPKGATEENLIYDFNLEVGDTLFSYLNWNQPLIVAFIDSVLINNNQHKKLVFQYGEAEIIEGIGSITGIVEELTAFEGGSNLCALYIDTNLAFPEYPCNLSATDSCLTLSIDYHLNSSEIRIYPNPAKYKFQITVPKEILLKKPNLKIMSALGKLYRSQMLTTEITNIDVCDLMSGMYIIQIISGNVCILSKKIVIEK